MSSVQIGETRTIGVPAIRAPKAPPALRLTERDYLLFAFLLEQGFMTLEAIYLAFFDVRRHPSDPFPRHLEVTRQRLRLLEKGRFILTLPVPMQSKGVYLLARRGYQALIQKFPERAFAAPPRLVDIATFEHDWLGHWTLVVTAFVHVAGGLFRYKNRKEPHKAHKTRKESGRSDRLSY